MSSALCYSPYMRRAARLDGNQSVIVRALLDAGCSVQSLAMVGCGCPDLLVWSPVGRYILMEIKDPTQDPNKRQLRHSQRMFIKWWQCPIVIVETTEQALRAIA